MNNYNLWLEMQNHPELRKALDYVRKIEIERDAALLRAAELERVLVDLLQSADQCWEDQHLGHDRVDAVKAARAALSGEEE